jgi:hypothetical protein
LSALLKLRERAAQEVSPKMSRMGAEDPPMGFQAETQF